MKKFLAISMFLLSTSTIAQPGVCGYSFTLTVNAPNNAVITSTAASDGFLILKTGANTFTVSDDGTCDASQASAGVTIMNQAGAVSNVTLKNSVNQQKSITALKVTDMVNVGSLQYIGMKDTGNGTYTINFSAVNFGTLPTHK